MRTVLPKPVVQHLGLRIRGQQIAQYANGSEESVGLTEPVIIEPKVHAILHTLTIQ